MKKLGVIGAGYWGPNIIRNLHELGVLKMVCDKERNKIEGIKKIYPNIETTTNPDKLIKNVDAVVIATEGKSHYKLAKKAITEGKDIFVEKPFTLKTNQCEELIELADKKNVIIMVGHILLYHDGIRKIKEYIENDTLGKIYYIYSQRLSLGKIRKDEDVLWSFGPHDVSVILYLLNNKMPKKLVASGGAFLHPNTFDAVFITLYFDEIIANIHLSWLDPCKTRKFTIVGDKKMIVFDEMEPVEKIKIYDKGADYEPSFKPYGEVIPIRIGDIIIPHIKIDEPLKKECKHFIECIKQRKKPLSDAYNGLMVVKILEKARESIEKKKVITFKE